MAKYTIYCSLIAALLILAGMTGCSNPESNPVVAPPPIVDGVTLDLNADIISPDPSGLPWIVKAHWDIPAGRTVRIEPGTRILFDSLWFVRVEGKIEANGSAEYPILFSSARRDADMGDWRGFQLKNPTEGSVFKHCIFTYGAYIDSDTSNHEAQIYRGMLSIDNSSPTIENCVLYRNQYDAVSLIGRGCAPRIRYNVITENDASAIRADTLVDLFAIDISYNNLSDNSSPCLMGFDSTLFCVQSRLNINRDSCDFFFNVLFPPLLTDPATGDFNLLSCSPCIDAGPEGVDPDPDGTRRDLAVSHYVQVQGELRGLIEGTLDAGIAYRVSCDVRVDSGKTLTIPAGTQIDVTGLYPIEVYGRLVIEGADGNPVTIGVDPATTADLWGGILFHNLDTLQAPSVVRYADFTDYKRMDISRAGMVVENSKFINGHDYGLSVKALSADETQPIRVAGCTFDNCGEFGVKSDSSVINISNTVIANSRGRGVWLNEVGSASSVTNCILRDCETIGLFMENFSSPAVVNNVIMGCGYYGMHLINNCLPLVQNNIIVNNARVGIWAQLSSTPTLAYNNIAGHSQNGSNTDIVPASLVCASCLSTDPMFVSATDLHLAPGSPCRDAGNPEPGYNDGTDGSRNDMGAYGGPQGASVGAPALHGRSAGVIVLR